MHTCTYTHIYIFTESILIRQNHYKGYIFKYGMQTVLIPIVITWRLFGWLNDKTAVKMVIAISYSYVDSPLFVHL